MSVSLKLIEDEPDRYGITYRLLAERMPNVNISHAVMPMLKDHIAFVDSHPYEVWYCIYVMGEPVGTIYLTLAPKKSEAGSEIGIFIFNKHKRRGYATAAIKQLMIMHPRDEYFANINVQNSESIALFEKAGFKLNHQVYKFTA